MMRYLSQEEKKNTISLWTEAFPEDSDSFLEYYYREKIKDNRILVAEEGQGSLAMKELVQLVKGEKSGEIHRIAGELIERGSCKAKVL